MGLELPSQFLAVARRARGRTGRREEEGGEFLVRALRSFFEMWLGGSD